MEGGQIVKKDMKVDIPSETGGNGMVDSQVAAGTGQSAAGAGQSTPGLARQQSMTKSNCLCSPTTHAGSFRCRLHRAPSLQRTKSMDAAANRDSASRD